jgi:translation elongation factor P/translation initiation factor 5A
MIINGQNFIKSYKCKKKMAEYLIYEKNIPPLDVDEKYWYFVDNELLQEILEGAPFWLKLLNNF